MEDFDGERRLGQAKSKDLVLQTISDKLFFDVCSEESVELELGKDSTEKYKAYFLDIDIKIENEKFQVSSLKPLQSKKQISFFDP